MDRPSTRTPFERWRFEEERFAGCGGGWTGDEGTDYLVVDATNG
jgi:hypothetical protein